MNRKFVMPRLFASIATIVTLFAARAFSDSDTRTVQAEFDRCDAFMERVERSLKRYEDAVEALKRSVVNLPATTWENVSRETTALENRPEYFRNRFERSHGQADKIRSDLKNVSGPVCPSCIESSVNMYCRNGETIQNDLDEYLAKAADIQNRLGMEGCASISAAKPKGDIAVFEQRRLALDSLHRSAPQCGDRPAGILHKQASVNLLRSDSLYERNDLAAARKELDIAASLLEKAAQRCAAK